MGQTSGVKIALEGASLTLGAAYNFGKYESSVRGGMR